MKYIATENLSVYKLNDLTIDYDFVTDKSVDTIKKGEIFEVEKVTSGGFGIAPTPYLILPNNLYVIGYYAVPYQEKIIDNIIVKNNKQKIAFGIIFIPILYAITSNFFRRS